MSPLRHQGIAQGIVVRVVIVDGHDEAVGAGIVLRERQTGNGELGTGGVTGNAQPAGGVVASGGAYGVYERLVPAVQDVILLLRVFPERFAPAPAAVLDFVEGFQYQPLSFVLEALGNLGPDAENHVLGLLGGLVDVQPIAFVVVRVHNGHQAGFLCISHNLFHTAQPFFVQAVGGSLSDVALPGDADAHGFEAGGLHPVQSGLGGFDIAPGGLGSHVVGNGIHVVAHVPAGSHGLEDHLRGDGSGRSCFRLLIGLQGKGNGEFLVAAGDGERSALGRCIPAGGRRYGDGRGLVGTDGAGLDQAPIGVGAGRGLRGRSNVDHGLSAEAVEGDAGLVGRQLHLGHLLHHGHHHALLVSNHADVGSPFGGSGILLGRYLEAVVIGRIGAFSQAHPGILAADGGLDAAGDGQLLGAAFCVKHQFGGVGGKPDGRYIRLFVLAAGGANEGQGRNEGKDSNSHSLKYYQSNCSAGSSLQRRPTCSTSKLTGALPRSGTLNERSMLS